MHYSVLPPEINSALIFAGAGSGPMLAAASAWDGLATELASAAVSFGSVTAGLVGGSWQGRSSVAMAAAAAPYAGWLAAAATQAEQAATQAQVMVAEFEAVRLAMVQPALVAANRSGLISLVISNLFGQNAPAIAAAEAAYEEMWALDVSAMAAYHSGASAVAVALPAFALPLRLPAGLAAGPAAVVTALTTAVGMPTFAGRAIAASLGLANVGGGNLGNANNGLGNIGNANLGNNNLGSGNFGSFNIGSANLGGNNIGIGNAGANNFGLANLGNLNTGFANAGIGNFGIANTGNNNIGNGLTGNNQIGIGGLNSGNGNVGLFNAGSANIGFFAKTLRSMVPQEHLDFARKILADHGVPVEDADEDSLQLLGWTEATATPQVDAALKHPKMTMVANALGTPPADMIKHIHDSGRKVAALCGSPSQARKHADAGVDIIIAQGGEAGGHCGEVGSIVLWPQVVKEVAPVPVLAAGGIGSGQQIAAALALGTQGAWTGSQWLMVEEAANTAVQQAAYVKATSRDTVRSRSFTGKPARMLRNDWTEAWEQPESPKPLGMPLQYMVSGMAVKATHKYPNETVDVAFNPVGQVVGQFTKVEKTATVIERWVQEYLEATARLDALNAAASV